jgi:hypothetical protein
MELGKTGSEYGRWCESELAENPENVSPSCRSYVYELTIGPPKYVYSLCEHESYNCDAHDSRNIGFVPRQALAYRPSLRDLVTL